MSDRVTASNVFTAPKISAKELDCSTMIIADIRAQCEYEKAHFDESISLSFPQILWRRLLRQKSKPGCLDEFLMCDTLALKKRHSGVMLVLYDDSTTDLSDCTHTHPLRVLCEILSTEPSTRFAFVEGGFKAIQEAQPDKIASSPFAAFFQPMMTLQCVPKVCPTPAGALALPLSFILGFMAIGSEGDAHNVSLLDAEGVTHVLNLTTVPCVQSVLDTRYCLQIPILDSPSQDILGYLPLALEFIQSVRDANGRLLVHCAAGISRSPTFAMAYLMYALRKSVNEAFSIVHAHRPIASPNLNFMGQLILFGKCLCLNNPHHSTSTPGQAASLANLCLRRSPAASPPSSADSISSADSLPDKHGAMPHESQPFPIITVV